MRRHNLTIVPISLSSFVRSTVRTLGRIIVPAYLLLAPRAESVARYAIPCGKKTGSKCSALILREMIALAPDPPAVEHGLRMSFQHRIACSTSTMRWLNPSYLYVCMPRIRRKGRGGSRTAARVGSALSLSSFCSTCEARSRVGRSAVSTPPSDRGTRGPSRDYKGQLSQPAHRCRGDLERGANDPHPRSAPCRGAASRRQGSRAHSPCPCHYRW